MPYLANSDADIVQFKSLSDDINDAHFTINKDTKEPEDPLLSFLFVSVSFLIIPLLFLVVLLVQKCCCSPSDELSDNHNDEANLLYSEMEEAENDTTALTVLSPDDQEIYFQAKEYIKLNGFAKLNLANWQLDMIKEKGVHAWEFIETPENRHSITIENKTEITFKTKNIPISIQSNLPIPNTKDVYYIEFKIFQIPEEFKNNTLLSLGLSTYPYPSFILPGRYIHSVAYDSVGDRRHNYPFPLTEFKLGYNAFPQLEKGDVVGIGFRRQTRVVFFTRNGKKLSESKVGGHVRMPKNVQLFPTIGSINPCRVDVNFGQMGYVFIEANVKKWALGPLRGEQMPPPLYQRFNNDVLLDASDFEDIELPEFEEVVKNNELNQPAEFTDDELDADEVTLRTLEVPPNYDHLIEDDIREAMEDSLEDIS